MRSSSALYRPLYQILGLAVILSFQACAPRPMVIPSTDPYKTEKINSILGHLMVEEQRVSTLFYSGKLTSKTRKSELEAMVSIVGRRKPFEARFEFTHPLGAPLAHLVINANRFKFLVFRDKRLYVGSTDRADLLRYFPFLPNPTVIWGFIRGYPVITAFHKASQQDKGAITLLNRWGEVIQRLHIDLKTHRPRALFYPKKKLVLYYKNFAKVETVEFARSVELRSAAGKGTLTLHIRQAIFNPTLPRLFFELKKPEGFELIDLLKTEEIYNQR